MNIPILETERLILRPVTLDDALSLQKHFNDWDIIKFLSARVPWPYPDNGTEVFLKDVALPAMARGDDLMWAITSKQGSEAGQAIGIIHYRLNPSPDESVRGFWLGRSYHGQGLMTEAVAVTQDYYFFTLGKEKLRVKNALSNIGSGRIKERSGAVLVQIEDKPCAQVEGPTQIWEITRESWERAKKENGF